MEAQAPQPQDSERPVDELAKACLDAPGYCVMIAILTPNPDPTQLPVVQYHYRRYHFGLEDARNAALVMAREVAAEARALTEFPPET